MTVQLHRPFSLSEAEVGASRRKVKARSQDRKPEATEEGSRRVDASTLHATKTSSPQIEVHRTVLARLVKDLQIMDCANALPSNPPSSS